VPFQSTPIKLSDTSPSCLGRVPGIGEHTDEVLAERLELPGHKIEELREKNVI
jgi:crotonobetainyl-CoA:carnitine CoA-transferase CaiB-like acyl-CoA transferase